MTEITQLQNGNGCFSCAAQNLPSSGIMETFRGNGAITADLKMLPAFNLLLHVKWPDFEPFCVLISYT